MGTIAKLKRTLYSWNKKTMEYSMKKIRLYFDTTVKMEFGLLQIYIDNET